MGAAPPAAPPPVFVLPPIVVPAPDAPPELRRSSAQLPSRVADNLYWLLPATGAEEHKWRQEQTRQAVRELMLRLQGREGEGTEAVVLRRHLLHPGDEDGHAEAVMTASIAQARARKRKRVDMILFRGIRGPAPS